MTSTHARPVIRPEGTVLVHSADPLSLEQLASAIRLQGFTILQSRDANEIAAAIREHEPAVCVLDEPDSSDRILDLARMLEDEGRTTQLVVLPARGATFGLEVSKLPNCDVLGVPFTSSRIAGALFSACARGRLAAENQQLKVSGPTIADSGHVGHTLTGRRLDRNINQAASHDEPVLVTGEAGSGLTWTARAIHHARHGVEQPLVIVPTHCLSQHSLELELFGDGTRPGRIAKAAGGTLIVERIDGVPSTLQRRLCNHLAASGARLIGTISGPSANHPELTRELSRLFAANEIAVPALRERRDDIPLLAAHLLSELAGRHERTVPILSEEAREELAAHSWRANLRELSRVLEQALLVSPGDVIDGEAVRVWIAGPEEQGDGADLTFREMERRLIEATFNRYDGNRELTAKALQIGVRTLSGKLREYGYPPRGGPGSNKPKVHQAPQPVIRRAA